MESGRRIYELSEYDLGKIVDEAIMTFEPTRTRRDVELTITIDRDLPRVICDRSAIIDSLVNLLSNAYKYGGDPRWIGVTVTIESRGVAVAVRDNGKGLARREHKRIFEKFYRVDDLLARRQEGSGLGLSIVRHVMKAHRGKIMVDSETGKGSTFTLILPSRPPRRAQAAREREPE